MQQYMSSETLFSVKWHRMSFHDTAMFHTRSSV